MFKPNNELQFGFSDLYPNWGGIDTSQLAVPESDDLDALNEDVKTAEEASQNARSKNIFVALGLMVALVVFFGGR